MRLGLWIDQMGYTQAEFGELVRAPQQVVSKWCSGRAIPRRHHMEAVVRVTQGEVTEADFYAFAAIVKQVADLSREKIDGVLIAVNAGTPMDRIVDALGLPKGEASAVALRTRLQPRRSPGTAGEADEDRAAA